MIAFKFLYYINIYIMFFYYENKELSYEDIPLDTTHVIIPNKYSFSLLNLPDFVNQITINSIYQKTYDSVNSNVEILNINLYTIGIYNIKINNLPPTLKKLRLLDYSNHSEFEFLTNNLNNENSFGIMSIEERRRKNMRKIIKNNILKIPFDCTITNKFDEELLDIIL